MEAKLRRKRYLKKTVSKDQLTDMFRVTSNRLLDLLIQFAEKSRSIKMSFLRRNGTIKRGINGHQTLTFLTFLIIKNLWLYS